MSRIYDAITKAEKEATRKLFEGTSANPAAPQPEVVSSAAAGAAAAPAIDPEARNATVSVPASSTVVDDEFPILAVPTDGPASTEQAKASVVAQFNRVTWNRNRKAVLFGSGQDASLDEQFRTLRSRLYQIREKRVLKKLLITSALPEEGKSFVATNLAHALAAQPGRRVLLIDADLRRSTLHSVMGATASAGLSEYLSEASGHAEIQHEQGVDAEGLFYLPAGMHHERPGDLLASDRLHELLDELSESFDWIVIDSPPVAPVSDASVLAKHCDGVLLVVRAGETPIEMAQLARQEFKASAPVGVVFNGFENKLPSHYQRGYYGTQRVQLNLGADPTISSNEVKI